MADGSITFDTELDNTKLQKQLSKAKREIERLEQSVSKTQSKRSQLSDSFNQLGGSLDAAKSKLSALEQEYSKVKRTLNAQSGRAGDFSNIESYIQAYDSEQEIKEALKTQQGEVAKIQKKWDSVAEKVEAYDSAIQDLNGRLNKQKELAGGLEQELAGLGPDVEKMDTATKKANKTVSKFALRIREVVRSALVFTLITQALAKFRQWVGKVIKTNVEATEAIGKLKGALLTLAQPLINIIIPAFTMFVNVLTKIITAIASVVSVLFGTTLKQSAESAQALNKEQEALSGVGSAANKAKKDLASFDEINKLVGDSAAGSGGNAGSTIQPDFSFLKDGVLSDLTFTLEDILFKWDGITIEDVLAKIITALGTIAGGVIGFGLGGPGGAVVGILLGAGVGILISNLIFNGDGKLDGEELLRSMILALGVLTGGVLGFSVGGPGGAAIGIFLGAGVSLAISKLLFDGDGQLNAEEVVSAIVVVLGAIAGGIAGFMAGGPGGAAVGILLGAGVALAISKMLFNGDGKLSSEEIISGIVVALGAIAGGIVGFLAGGPGGAAVGVLVGAGAAVIITGLSFNADGKIDTHEILTLLNKALFVICAGVLGFGIGGPGGALIGITIAAGVELLINHVSFSDKSANKRAGYEEGAKIGENATKGAKDKLGVNSPSTEFKKIGSFMTQGMENGIEEGRGGVTFSFSGLLSEMQTQSKSTTSQMRLLFSEFLLYLATEFKTGWETSWQSFKEISSRNIQSIITDINALNAKLASIERNITITITTVYKSVGGSGSSSSSKSSTARSAARVADMPATLRAIPMATGGVIPPNREFLALYGDQRSGNNIEAPESLLRKIAREENGNSQIVPLLRALLDAVQAGKTMEVDGTPFGRIVYDTYNRENRRHGTALTVR